MSFWHMQLHDDDIESWSIEDIKQILSHNIIGCSGEPVDTFYNIEINDTILIRHGGQIIALVKAISNARKVREEEQSDYEDENDDDI